MVGACLLIKTRVKSVSKLSVEGGVMALLRHYRVYCYYRSVLQGETYPLMYIDMDLFSLNIQKVLDCSATKTIRIASKSLRCRYLMDYILKSNNRFVGIMCYSPLEACWLSKLGYDNILIAYPTTNKSMIAAVVDEVAQSTNRELYLTVDCEEHVKLINTIAASRNVIMSLCVDLDMSTSYAGIYFGVHRSSISSLEELTHFLDCLDKYKHVRLVGVLAYEAQVAGLGDTNNSGWFRNLLVRYLKHLSIPIISHRRHDMIDLIQSKGHSLTFVNGGGTGSLASTRCDDSVTEVTVGSAFYCPTLFDAYNDFTYYPACGFAVEITRHPRCGVFTCAGGGYVASGGVGLHKVPQVYLPPGVCLDKNEMAGEVQTPVHVRKESFFAWMVYFVRRVICMLCGGENGRGDSIGELDSLLTRDKGGGAGESQKLTLALGDPVLMRHSKAGELCERFLDVKLIANGTIVDRVPTYRGEGMCFL